LLSPSASQNTFFAKEFAKDSGNNAAKRLLALGVAGYCAGGIPFPLGGCWRAPPLRGVIFTLETASQKLTPFAKRCSFPSLPLFSKKLKNIKKQY
jgi:hypothetical protein